MKADKRPLYLWAIVLLVNVIVALEVLLFYVSRDVPLLTTRDLKMLGFGLLFVIIPILFVTIVPVLISGSKIKFKHYLGYGIPVLFLLSTLWLIYEYHICEPIRSFLLTCGPELASIKSWGFLSIISALFYTLGIYARKLNVKFVLFLFIAVFFLLVGSLLHLDFDIYHRILIHRLFW